MAQGVLDARSRLATRGRPGKMRGTAYAGRHRAQGRSLALARPREAVPDLADAELSQLLQRCALGDKSAFRTLYESQSARLHGLALRITRDPALAADATHDAFVQVWRQAQRFDPGRGAAGAWLVSILRYRALDIIRRRQRERPGYEPPEMADETPDALAQLQASAEGAALRACLEELEPDRQRLLLRAFADGLSHSELAAETGTPLGTVKSWIRRALAALKRCLER